MKPHVADVVVVDRALLLFGKDSFGHGDWSIHVMDGGVSKASHGKRLATDCRRTAVPVGSGL